MMPSMILFRSNIFRTRFKRCRVLFFVLFAFAAQISESTAQPVLSPPVLVSNGTQAQMIVSNCFPGLAEYLLQVSTNLTDWSTISTNTSIGSNFFVTVPVNGSGCFYRLEIQFPPAFGILCKNKFDATGNNYTLDSFDSSAAVGGQWSPAVRQANGNIGAIEGVLNSLNVGNANIYGSVYTGPGSSIALVQIGKSGSVGDIAWITATNHGIEPGHWQTNLNVTVPDVIAPNTAGWLAALPAPTNGVIMLTNAANYVVSNLPSSLVITAPTTIWVQGSTSLGVTISNRTWIAGGRTNTTYGQLILYVGQSSGSGTSLDWSGQGTFNVPGYAVNLQIYGLPSLSQIDFQGNVSWNAVVYAPEAAFMVGGGGNNYQDVSGEIVANSVTLNGHWNFHYDQNLTITGPRF